MAAAQELAFSQIEKGLRELVAIGIWLGALSKLLVFDVDSWALGLLFPQAPSLLPYRVGLALIVLAAIALTWKKRILIRWLFFIIFYPIVWICWRIPRWFIQRRAWTMAVALLIAISSAVRELRKYILILVAMALGTICIALSGERWVLGVGAVLVIGALVALFVDTIIAALRPTLDVFSHASLSGIRQFLRTGSDHNHVPVKPRDQMDASELRIWVAHLQWEVIYNHLCLFIAERLRTIHNSGLGTIVSIGRLCLLFFATVWSFYFLNLALLSWSSQMFAFESWPSRFDVLYYSFTTLFNNAAPGLAPVGVPAKVLAMCGETWMYLIYGVVLVFVVTALGRARDDEAIESTIATLRSQAGAAEMEVSQRFGVNLLQALAAMQELKASAIGIVYYLTPSLRPRPGDDGGKE